jgi:hypothetical protein
MTAPLPRAVWQGPLPQGTFRVVDLGVSANPRLVVERQNDPDSLGGRGWTRFEPIPRDVFEAMLIQAGVIH